MPMPTDESHHQKDIKLKTPLPNVKRHLANNYHQ